MKKHKHIIRHKIKDNCVVHYCQICKKESFGFATQFPDVACVCGCSEREHGILTGECMVCKCNKFRRKR